MFILCFNKLGISKSDCSVMVTLSSFISFIVCLFRIRQKAFNDICKVFTYLLSSGTDIDSVDYCNQAK